MTQKRSKKRRRHSAAFKARVAREAMKEDRTNAQLASEFEVHSSQVALWKKQAIKRMSEVFSTAPDREEQESARREAELYEQIGRLKVEVDWLKKKTEGLG